VGLIKVALAGNPNSGKSTVFNALTGSRQHVGNWPGKTVEHKFGHFSHNGYNIEVTDLPGAYSLAPWWMPPILNETSIL
jgi:ferrous iron transport protein B